MFREASFCFYYLFYQRFILIPSPMQENNSKNFTPKRSGLSNPDKIDNSNIYNASSQDFTLRKQSTGSEKTKDQDKGFTFSLNYFEKNYGSRKTASQSSENIQKSSNDEGGSGPEPLDIEKESKRQIIYASESYQDEEEKEQIITTQSNNNLFSMIFLNKGAKVEQPAKQIPSSVEPVFSKHKNAPPPLKPKQPAEQPSLKIEDFEVGKKLGAGKFGQVYLARHKASGFVCALKKIEKAKVDSKLAVQLLRQIKIQMFLNHPNIVKMFCFFSDSNYIYLGMELCFSGQLYQFLKKRRRIPEDMTRNIVSQVCRALDYMHENEIIHRDLKPQNIIYQCGLVKICDFGWSISTNTMRGTFCGTPLYVSPELLKRKNYNNKIDVWSVGILTYQLLFGKVPFEIQTEQDFIKIVEDEIKFSKITKISNEAKDFILNCLQKDPRDRYTVPELLEHHFLSRLQNVSMVDMY